MAAELDKAAYEEGRPAIHKLQMLADVDRVSFLPSRLVHRHPASDVHQQLLHLPCRYSCMTGGLDDSSSAGGLSPVLRASVMRHNTMLL